MYQRRQMPGAETRPPQQPTPSCSPPQQQPTPKPPHPHNAPQKSSGQSRRSSVPFLENLLPNTDSGDLLVLLILILLLAEGNEDSSSVVTTLAIFLFLR